MSTLAYQQQEPLTQSLNTLVLRDVLAALSLYSSKIRILDLGPARADSIAFFNQFNCKLFVADIIQELPYKQPLISSTDNSVLADDEQNSIILKLEETLGCVIPAKQEFDLILSWDILNYIDTSPSKHLINYLSQHTHSHSLLHAFISTSQYINASLGFFTIGTSDTVLYQSQGERIEQQPLTRYQMQKLFPNLTVTKAILMRNGLQEMALRFRQN